jgi:predicted nucleic-acid-binding Zn-ribbon protein
MNKEEDLEEKKLLGSGGYAFAKLTEQEEAKASLGVPQIFLSKLGRLNEERFTKYYCNNCGEQYPGSPAIVYENPNEQVGKDIVLVEKGEYKCRKCNNVLALYRRFDK